jgi:hypothetical protein
MSGGCHSEKGRESRQGKVNEKGGEVGGWKRDNHRGSGGEDHHASPSIVSPPRPSGTIKGVTPTKNCNIQDKQTDLYMSIKNRQWHVFVTVIIPGEV